MQTHHQIAGTLPPTRIGGVIFPDPTATTGPNSPRSRSSRPVSPGKDAPTGLDHLDPSRKRGTFCKHIREAFACFVSIAFFVLLISMHL